MGEPATGIDSAIGNDKLPPVHILPETHRVKRQTYRRTSQHYVTNNNTSMAPTVTVKTNSAGVDDVTNFASFYYSVFDQGFVNIPFTSTCMAMDASDWDEVQAAAQQLRIVDCGFRIIRVNCCQQTVNSVGSTTTVTNQFTQAPTMMLVKDHDHVLAQMATVGNTAGTPANLFNVIGAPGQANRGFAANFSGGLLPSVKWLQVSGAGSTMDAEHGFDVMKGGDVVLMSTSDTYSYKWMNPDTRWMMPLLSTNNPNLQDETIRNTAFYAPTFQGSIVAAIQQNLGTNVNRNLLDTPTNHFIRVPPLHSIIGPEIVVLELWIEYSMTVEWISGRYLTTRVLTGTDNSMLAGNFIPFPVYRRNILALSDGNPPPPTLAGGSAEKSKKRKTEDEQRVPARKPQAPDYHDGAFSAIPKPKRYVAVDDDDEE